MLIVCDFQSHYGINLRAADVQHYPGAWLRDLIVGLLSADTRLAGQMKALTKTESG